MAKKITAFLIMCAALFNASQAQKIENGSKWWDGYALWEATMDMDSDIIYFRGEEPNGDIDYFQLQKLPGNGMYGFVSDRPNFNKFNADLSCRVKYIRKDGMYFLSVQNKNGDAVWIFLLTPDNLENCMAQQKALEGQLPSNLLCNTLLNTAYLDFFSVEELRLMRNEILARHGYNFQSKDLKDYFSQKSWYKPAKSNSSIKLNIIEETNVQLIKSIEAIKKNIK